MTHVPHPHLENRKKQGAATTGKEHVGFNGWLAVNITNIVGTMWCAYAFAILAFISLPEAIRGGTASLIAWIAQTFLQLVLLSIIMVGQKVAAAASDKQALQTGRRSAARTHQRHAKTIETKHPTHRTNSRPDEKGRLARPFEGSSRHLTAFAESGRQPRIVESRSPTSEE